jgi:hypothetical protein
MHTISISPKNGIGFNLAYDNHQITIPGFKCPIKSVEELSLLLVEDWGCDEEQLRNVLTLITCKKEGLVDPYGYVLKN